MTDLRSFPFENPDPLSVPEEFAELRRNAPVAPVVTPWGTTAWVVTTYEQVREALSDTRLSARFAGFGADKPEDDKSLLQDPPEHTRLRKAVNGAFTARRVAALTDQIREICDSLADELQADGSTVDLLGGFSFPLSITVISRLIGVPADEHMQFVTWSDALFRLSTQDDMVQVRDAGLGLSEYAANLVERKRQQPGDDLFSALITLSDRDEDQLDTEELATLAMTLLAAGYVATANAIGLGALVLLRGGGFADLVRDRSLIPTTVDEILRHQAFGGAARVAREDLHIGGVQISEGDLVLASVASANRDESVYEAPEEFRLDRRSNTHLAFGHGIHHCLGAALAKAELNEAFRTLVERFPNMKLATPSVEWRTYLFGELFGDQGPREILVDLGWSA